jgi:hypothetical protein
MRKPVLKSTFAIGDSWPREGHRVTPGVIVVVRSACAARTWIPKSSIGNSPVRLERDYAGQWPSIHPKRIVERVVVIGIAMGPAVDRDRGHVACRVKSARPKTSQQQFAIATCVYANASESALAMARCACCPAGVGYYGDILSYRIRKIH